VIILVYRGIYIYTRAYTCVQIYIYMANFKLSKGTLESPRCNYSTKQSYQGVAPVTGLSDKEAQNIDEHDNAIPKKEKKKKIPTISTDNNLQTATGGTRFKKPSASKRTPDPLPPRAKEEQPKTQSLNKKVYKPKPQDIDKKTTNK